MSGATRQHGLYWERIEASWEAARDEGRRADGERSIFVELLDQALALAARDQVSFWDWALKLPFERRRNGSLVGNVLLRWGHKGRPKPDAELLGKLKAGDPEAKANFESLWSAYESGRKPPVPRRALRTMLAFAVAETCPSYNRTFIEPCVWAFGRKAVVEILLEHLENGTPGEKAGAANALYWANAFGPDDRDEATRARQRRSLLEQFLAATDLDVRRAIIAKLDLKPESWPEDLRPLAAKAVEAARSSGDEYLTHRVEVQLGGGGPYMALPPREGGGQ